MPQIGKADLKFVQKLSRYVTVGPHVEPTPDLISEMMQQRQIYSDLGKISNVEGSYMTCVPSIIVYL